MGFPVGDYYLSLLRDQDLANSLGGDRGELERRGFHAGRLLGI